MYRIITQNRPQCKSIKSKYMYSDFVSRCRSALDSFIQCLKNEIFVKTISTIVLYELWNCKNTNHYHQNTSMNSMCLSFFLCSNDGKWESEWNKNLPLQKSQIVKILTLFSLFQHQQHVDINNKKKLTSKYIVFLFFV